MPIFHNLIAPINIKFRKLRFSSNELFRFIPNQIIEILFEGQKRKTNLNEIFYFIGFSTLKGHSILSIMGLFVLY